MLCLDNTGRALITDSKLANCSRDMTNFLMAILLEIIQQGHEPGTVNVSIEISISALNCQAYMTYLIQSIPWVTESYFNTAPYFLQPAVGKVSFITPYYFFLITRIMDYCLYPKLLISLKFIISCLEFDKELSQKIKQHWNHKDWTWKHDVSFCSNCCSPSPLLGVFYHTKTNSLFVPAQQFVELQCKLD